MRVAILEAGQPNAGDPLPRSGAGIATRGAVVTGAGRHVLQDRLPGEHGVALENVADAAGDALDGLPFHADLAGAGGLEA